MNKDMMEIDSNEIKKILMAGSATEYTDKYIICEKCNELIEKDGGLRLFCSCDAIYSFCFAAHKYYRIQ